jgi:hypothetical protein
VPPRFTDTYVVRIKFMSGDADAYETRETRIKELHKVERVAEFLTALDDAKYRYDCDTRRLENDTWRDLPCAWVIDHFHDWRKRPDADITPLIEWGRDSTSDGQCYASLDAWSIAYYDAQGNEFACAVSST